MAIKVFYRFVEIPVCSPTMRLEGRDGLLLLLRCPEDHLLFIDLALRHQGDIEAPGHVFDEIAVPGHILLYILIICLRVLSAYRNHGHSDGLTLMYLDKQV